MIRATRKTDCDAIAAIEAQAFKKGLDRVRLLKLMEMGVFCGFVDDVNIPNISSTLGKLSNCGRPSVLVGYLLATIISDEAEVLSIAVNADHQKCGRGKRLLSHFLAFIATQDVKTVLLEVAADNMPALTLYHRHGFAEFGRRTSYYKRSDGNCDAIMMRWLNE